MASNPSRVSASEARLEVDDFTIIRGIGPGIESRLHGAGILTFAQLAALSPDEVATLVAGMIGKTVEHITRQDWIGQARELALTSPTAEAQGEATTSTARQHYATFTVELLLDEDNDVRRTRVVHVQTGTEDAWAGWQDARLVGFFVQHAELPIPPAEPTPAVAVLAEPTPAVAVLAEPTPPAAAPAEPASPPLVAADLAGAVRLSELAMVPDGADDSHQTVPHGQLYNVHLTLDLADVVAPHDLPFNYAVTVYAKSLHSGTTHIVAESRGGITAGGRFPLSVPGLPLVQGIYRLEAAAALTLPSTESRGRPGLATVLEGGLFQVS